MFHPIDGLADTIVAASTARGPAARAVVRVSGARALECVEGTFAPTIAGERGGTRVAGAIALDDVRVAAAAWIFRAPRSYTGEDVVEIHTIGAPPLVERLCGAIAARGARPARPGEFTRRAFEAGRIDLTAAEAVLALVGAADEREAREALRQLRGGLAREVEALRESLLDALAELEAALDFAHEDLEHDLIERADLLANLAAARERIARILAREAGRGAANGRPSALLYGPPNAGKSSLLNALARGDCALVSPEAGTTRDAVTAEMQTPQGFAVDLVDAAGVAEGAHSSEAERRSEAHLAAADLAIVVIDGSRPATGADLQALARTRGRPRLVVLQKSDLPRALEIDLDELLRKQERVGSAPSPEGEEPPIAVSAKTGAGLDALAAEIAGRLARRAAPADGVAPNERHRASLAAADRALAAALALLAEAGPPDIAAIDLRAALDALAEVTGAACADDVLDRIFTKFCIGK